MLLTGVHKLETTLEGIIASGASVVQFINAVSATGLQVWDELIHLAW